MAAAQVILPDGRKVDTTSLLWQQLRAKGQNPIATLSIMPDISDAQFPPSMGAVPSVNPALSGTPPQGTTASLNARSAVNSNVPVGTVPQTPTVVIPAAQIQRDSLLKILIPDSLMLPSLNLRGTEVRDALSALGLQYGVSLLIDPSVTGSVTLNLRHIKLRDALRLIVHESGLSMDPLPGAVKVWKQPPSPPPPRLSPSV